jgi:type I restriction enzyme S subunit
VREGWKEQSLADACQFINGLWKGKVEPFIPVGVIRNTNFTKDGRLDDSDIAYLDVEAKQYSKRRLKYGDIILEKSGGGPKQPVGRVVFFDKKEGNFSFSNFTSAIRVKEPNILDSAYLHKYLFWVYLSGRTESMQSHSTGIRNLNSDAYKAINIPIPPLPEQRRIVAILDEAFEGIATAKANAEKNLQNAREVFESHLNAVFSQRGEGWVEKLFEECIERVACNTKIQRKDYLSEGPYPIVSQEDAFINGFWDKKEDLLAVDSPVVVFGDHTRTLKYIDFDFVLGADGVKVLKPKPFLYPKFFYYQLQTAKLDSLGYARHYRLLKESSVWYPPITEQRRIVAILDRIHEQTFHLESLYQQKLTALDELKQSLLHQAFNGDL